MLINDDNEIQIGSENELLEQNNDNINYMADTIARLQTQGTLTGNVTYSAALFGSGNDSIEYCLSNDKIGKKCVRVGPSLIDMLNF